MPEKKLHKAVETEWRSFLFVLLTWNSTRALPTTTTSTTTKTTHQVDNSRIEWQYSMLSSRTRYDPTKVLVGCGSDGVHVNTDGISDERWRLAVVGCKWVITRPLYCLGWLEASTENSSQEKERVRKRKRERVGRHCCQDCQLVTN